MIGRNLVLSSCRSMCLLRGEKFSLKYFEGSKYLFFFVYSSPLVSDISINGLIKRRRDIFRCFPFVAAYVTEN